MQPHKLIVSLLTRFTLVTLAALVSLGLVLMSAPANATVDYTQASSQTFSAAEAKAKINQVIAFAKAQIGKPYSWGATGPGSYDCSGLTQAAFKKAGINLPRNSTAQAEAGMAVGYDDLQPGDLVYWSNPHIALYIGNRTVITAPQEGENVREQKIWPGGFKKGVRIIKGGNTSDADSTPAPKPTDDSTAKPRTAKIETVANTTSDVYTVAPGDALSTIGPKKLNRSDLDWQDWRNANTDKVSDPNVIRVGLQLRIPTPDVAAPAAAPASASQPKPAAPKPTSKPAVTTSAGAIWDRLAHCESSGNWAIKTGNGFSGGLQFTPSTWRAFGGSGEAHKASREQQIAVAKKVLKGQGWGAWPACTRKLGYGAKEKATVLA